MTAQGAAPVIYAYDTAGRLETITQAGEVFTYSYDVLSRLTGVQRPNGVRTAYAYDAVNRLARMTHINGVGQSIEDFTYTYTADNQIAAVSSIGSNQLLPNARTVGQADAGNRISQNGGTSYAFNPEGQTTSKTDAQGATGYQWDARGRLKQVLLPDGQSVNYGYDALGRLSSRSAGTSTTNFLYDGADVVRDTRTDGPTVNYINGPGIDQKLRQGDTSGNLYFLKDHLGSTVALTDASGAVVERMNYEAFGANNGSGLTRYTFTGRERDPATGLLYYRNRWQDPQQGRFLSEDPIGFDGGLNLYAYVGNDPLSYVDPFGLSWETFLQGLVDGGIEGFVYGLIFAALFSALAAATAGTALAVLPPILAAYMGATAAIALAEEIAALITEKMCPDDWHYRAGRLIGNVLGGLAGGGMGAGRGRPNSFGSNGGNRAPRTKGDRYSGRYADGQKAYRNNVPRNKKGDPIPLEEAKGPHNRFNPDKRDPNRPYSSTEFDANGNAVGRTDFAGRPGETLPHYHPYDPGTKGFGPKGPLP